MEDVALPGLLVCQETLQPLRRTQEGLWSDAAQRLYPVKDGLVYMGFPKRDEAMIATTMQEEHEWQGTIQTIARDERFLRRSVPRAVHFINLINRHVSVAQPRLIELGSGSGWVSWLFAKAGYEVYFCDFEANSLFLGQQFEHPVIRVGKRIVSDGRYAPFASGTFDVVVFKEFVHHVEDFFALFREANRLLRPGGVIALMEPTMSLVKRVYGLRHPDPHEGHRITWPGRYLRALASLGFETVLETAVYLDHEPRNPVLRALKREAATRAGGGRQLDVFGRFFLNLGGGAQLLAIARKASNAPPAERPPMTVIEPSTMTTTPADCEVYGRLVPVVAAAAEELQPVTPC